MAFLKPKFKFGSSGGSGNPLLDETEHQRQEELGRLYTSTRAAKHFQKDVVKGIEGFVGTGNKQLEIANKLAEDCKKYGSEGPSVKAPLSRATIQYGSARNKMEKERDNFHKALTTLVGEPLKAMINGAPLKDARNLKQKYDRLRQDADSQATEVTRRRAKEAKEGSGNPEQVAKLQAAEQKMQEITSAMETVGKNATTSMGVVESQQQTITLQKILAMIEYERAYYQRVTGILDQLHLEIESNAKGVSNPSNGAAAAPPTPPQLTSFAHNGGRQSTEPHSLAHSMSNGSSEDSYSDKVQHQVQPHPQPQPAPAGDIKSFYATCTHDFEGEDEGELTISVGDEVLVRQVTTSGWSEGQCNDQSGWFPSTYVTKKEPVRRGRSGSNHR
ncbi:hypothetical protein KC19_11G030300 [Ceratodon purpureus]|uniref:SH3 domain-containing protein n=1 Tax=Ceratodon purpureus TaxID=3225 RepID=A0A8T0GAD2_CERPU|nr:hypothetical protein KC19_11G030300 [Ceratodon purpureus]